MKATTSIVALCSLWVSSFAQDLSSGSAVPQPNSGPSTRSGYYIAARDLHSRLWNRINWFTNAIGEAVARTNGYTEIATGLSHWSADHSQLVDSSPEIVISPTGAQATNTWHSVSFLGNINTFGAVTVTLPDGQNLALSPLCLSYFDKSTGQAVLLGQVTNAAGFVLPSGREVIYPSAYTDIQADIIYANSIVGLEQLVVFRQQPPEPGEWGLDPATTFLQVITEIVGGPIPHVSPVASDDTEDNDLDFGSMLMLRGVGFSIGTETNQVRVEKHYAVLNGRSCLIEQVPFVSVQPELQTLEPAPTTGSLDLAPNSVVHRLALEEMLPPRRPLREETPEMKLATSSPSDKGFAMDFNLSGNQTNLVLQSDTTYYCSGTVNVSQNLYAEGGTVVKMTNSTAATIIASNVVQKTAPFRPVVITSKDDNSLGDAIAGSTGSPSGYYGNIALDLTSVPSGLVLSNWHFAYLSNALRGSSLVLRDVQFTRCKTVLAASSSQPSFYNVLLYLINTVSANSSADTVSMQNVLATIS